MMRAVLPPARWTGPALIAGLAGAWAVLWFAAGPPGQPAVAYLGQFLGAESVLLLSIGLVLISTLPWCEAMFDGIDRAAIWHRRVAITGTILLVPHIILSASPHRSSLGPLLGVTAAAGLLTLAVWAVLPRWRSVLPRPLHGPVLAVRRLPGLRHLRKALGGYELWRSVHRLTGLFVAAGFAHGLLDGTPFPHAQVLRWSFVAIGGVGLAFYLYRELLARYFVPLYDYQVAHVHQVGAGITEIALAPLGRPASFAPGQFAMLYLEAIDGWHRHPFTITSAPGDRLLSFAIKALGDDTAQLPAAVQPGMPAVIRGPFGRFSHHRGTRRQLWIAGGIGVTPFLGWLRALDAQPPRGPVDLFYTSAGPDMPYTDELTARAAGCDLIRVHIIDSRDGRLTAAQIMASTDGENPDALSVFMCGPAGMTRTFQAEFRRAGIPRRHIYREYFDWR
jgi:predicted ferric reductase